MAFHRHKLEMINHWFSPVKIFWWLKAVFQNQNLFLLSNNFAYMQTKLFFLTIYIFLTMSHKSPFQRVISVIHDRLVEVFDKFFALVQFCPIKVKQFPTKFTSYFKHLSHLLFFFLFVESDIPHNSS